MQLDTLTDALSRHMPSVLRWGGAIARRMRHFNIAITGKHSGSASTDALTLADLTIQELLVGALRDCDPIFRQCRIEAEETTGDLQRFAAESPYTLALDPIDGTKQYRDKSGNGYALILTLRSRDDVHYSLVYVPESGADGSWVRAVAGQVTVGRDDPSQPAADVVSSLPAALAVPADAPRKIYMIGFQQQERAKAELVTQAGLIGVPADDCAGCIYELLARREYAGSLIHSPNVYDYPASLQICRALGGDSVWVDTRQPVNFDELWLDERANMLRLPRIVATSPDRKVVSTLCDVAQSWNPVRYAE